MSTCHDGTMCCSSRRLCTAEPPAVPAGQQDDQLPEVPAGASHQTGSWSDEGSVSLSFGKWGVSKRTSGERGSQRT